VNKQKLEEFVAVWKVVMAKSENIVKYIRHWYDDVNEYSYILMEYCAGGDLAKEIEKRINEKKPFTQQVYLLLLIRKRDVLNVRRCANTRWRLCQRYQHCIVWE
jgi:serine/threonine protein kinase